MTKIITIYLSATGSKNPSIYTKYQTSPTEEIHGCIGTTHYQDYTNLYDLALAGNKLRFEWDNKINFKNAYFTKQDIVSLTKHNFLDFIKSKYGSDFSERVKNIDEIINKIHSMVEVY